VNHNGKTRKHYLRRSSSKVISIHYYPHKATNHLKAVCNELNEIHIPTKLWAYYREDDRLMFACSTQGSAVDFTLKGPDVVIHLLSCAETGNKIICEQQSIFTTKDKIFIGML